MQYEIQTRMQSETCVGIDRYFAVLRIECNLKYRMQERLLTSKIPTY